MEAKDLARLKHMLDSVNAILSFIKGKRRASLDNNRLLISGIIREFEVLGEAARQISDQTVHSYPKWPWKQLIGMRNRLIHAYFDVDYDIVWKTAKEQLPILKKQLEDAIFQSEK